MFRKTIKIKINPQPLFVKYWHYYFVQSNHKLSKNKYFSQLMAECDYKLLGVSVIFNPISPQWYKDNDCNVYKFGIQCI